MACAAEFEGTGFLEDFCLEEEGEGLGLVTVRAGCERVYGFASQDGGFVEGGLD